MAELIASGRIVDLILAILVAEAAILIGLAVVGRLPARLTGLLRNLAAAGFLLLGARMILVGADWKLTGACLGAALFAHVGDLILRLRKKRPGDSE